MHVSAAYVFQVTVYRMMTYEAHALTCRRGGGAVAGGAPAAAGCRAGRGGGAAGGAGARGPAALDARAQRQVRACSHFLRMLVVECQLLCCSHQQSVQLL